MGVSVRKLEFPENDRKKAEKVDFRKKFELEVRKVEIKQIKYRN